MRILFALLLAALLPCPVGAQTQDAVGRCYVNRQSGALAGKIVAVTPHPRTKRVSYKVEDGRGGHFYLSPDNGTVMPCGQAAARQASVDSLVGKCVFNRSDDKFLGRVMRAGGADANGQRRLTIALVRTLRDALGQSSMEVTYPRNAALRSCKRSID
jgi:hypothetical protein